MQIIKINPSDNVAVALEPIEKGNKIELDGENIKARNRIPAGHKVAVKDTKENEPVIKYGCRIGFASADIFTGEWVHTHNTKTALSGLVNYTYNPQINKTNTSSNELFFNGFLRENGTVGTRNELWIIPTVGCVNGIVKSLEAAANEYVGGSIEAAVAFNHPYGCSQLGEDQENTRKILASLVNHPNAGAVLVVGLGCENSGIETLKKYIGHCSDKRVAFLNCQDFSDEIAEGKKLLKSLAFYAGSFSRQKLSASKLIVGLKCGGSDGLSGITANPLVGRFSDILVSQGGTTILTEVPEMFGAEQSIMNRCADETLFDKTVSMINNFKTYYQQSGQPIYENPSPGNKAGGITTLEDKSLGCTQKSGTSPVTDVLEYGDKAIKSGLNLLSAPGNDLVAATALAASGAQIVLFTTGRGTPFGAPVPTMKISSGTPLSVNKSNWIDFNAGVIAQDKTLDDMSGALMEKVLAVASGEKVKSELNGCRDMAIFKKGVTL